jgi:hypothetical protein
MPALPRLSELSVTGHSIVPAFDPERFSYTLTVPNNVTSVTVVAVAATQGATIEGDGIHNLIVGANRIAVIVTYPDGATQEYTITVTRQAAGVARPPGGGGGGGGGARQPTRPTQRPPTQPAVGGPFTPTLPDVIEIAQNAPGGTGTIRLPQGSREIVLIYDRINALLREGTTLRIVTDNASAILPTGVLEEIATGQTVRIILNVGVYPDSSLAVDVTIIVGTTTVRSLVVPYAIQVYAPNIIAAGQNAYRVIAIDADGNIIGGILNPTTGMFEFRTNLAGSFSILYVEDLIRINMQVNSPVISDTARDITVLMDTLPIIQDGRTLVPIRFISEALDAPVSWNSATAEVTLVRDGHSLSFTIGEMAPGMDVPAQIMNDRTVVPVRFIAEFFGAVVTFDAGTGIIEIFVL